MLKELESRQTTKEQEEIKCDSAEQLNFSTCFHAKNIYRALALLPSHLPRSFLPLHDLINVINSASFPLCRALGLQEYFITSTVTSDLPVSFLWRLRDGWIPSFYASLMDAKCKKYEGRLRFLVHSGGFPPRPDTLISFSACVILEVLHSTLPNSPANHLRPPSFICGMVREWSDGTPIDGKIGICKARSDVWHRSTFGAFISAFWCCF